MFDNKSQPVIPANLPIHVGFIMDGNGRWAKKRALPRSMGHKRGVEVFKQTVKDCKEIGLRYVTFYAFSTENWSRPKSEVDYIMDLIRKFAYELDEFIKNGARLNIIGDISVFSEDLQHIFEDARQKSAQNDGIIVNIAINYGGRAEILTAAKRVAKLAADNSLNADTLSEEDFAEYLYTNNMPDVDVVIRPSGEQRLSNFLLWQSAYAEFVFMDVLWPDFNKTHLITALKEYADRSRRFGGI